MNMIKENSQFHTQKRLVLVGPEHTKRTAYFMKAADELQVPVTRFEDCESYARAAMAGDVVKIDPPVTEESRLEYLKEFSETYIRALEHLESLETAGIAEFLNSPAAVVQALDKRVCKKLLLDAGVSTPPPLWERPTAYDDFLSLLEEKNCSRVFVKPRYGSGAAGVCAFAWNKKRGRGDISTSLALQDGGLVNTKRVTKSGDEAFCRSIIQGVLEVDAVIEQWIPKPRTEDGIVYDFRVLWQPGGAQVVVPRGSKWPITNLHLNNMALDIDKVSFKAIESVVYEECGKGAKCISGLHTAGMDVICSQWGKPYIIEINGQGDLIYKDIYSENRIYKSQILYMTGRRRQP